MPQLLCTTPNNMKKAVLIIASFFILVAWVNRFLGNYIVKVACAEYKVSALYNNGTVWCWQDNGAGVHWQPLTFGGRTAIDIHPGFNKVIIIDDQNYPWYSTPTTGHADSCTRFSTDSSGASFNYTSRVFAFGDCYFFVSIDSTKIYCKMNSDPYRWIDGTGSRVTKPFLLYTAPTGRTVKKMSCGVTCFILLDNGDLYARATSASSFTKKTFPANSFCTDVAASYRDINYYAVHDYPGGDSTQGKAYWDGSESGQCGDVASRANPFPLQSIWHLSYPIRSIVANDNTCHFIDSNYNLFGVGDNAQGEVGNGTELVNTWNYTNFTTIPSPYQWTGDKNQFVIVPPVQIGVGVQWRKLHEWCGFVYYCYASDVNDSIYRWGESKSFDLWPYTANNEATYRNCWDILTPTMYTPKSYANGSYITFVLPKVHCIAGQPSGTTINVTTSSISIGGLDTAAFAGAVGYSPLAYQWIKKSGSSVTFGTPTASTTTINGLTNGTYVFYKKMTDNNTGIWADSVNVNVNLSNSCSLCWVGHKVYRTKKLSR